MTIPIENTDIRAENIVNADSRYIDKNVIYWSERKIITFETYIRNNYVPSGEENVMLITKGVEYRPDLVSYDVYGDPNFWWRILEANKMNDIWSFQSGKTILLPNIF